MPDYGEAGYWQPQPFNRVSRRRLLRGGAALVTGVMALGLLGCNGDGRQSAPVTRAAAAAAGPVTPATAAPRGTGTPVQAGSFKTGGTIQGSIISGPKLDPVVNGAYLTQQLAGFHYSRLFRFNSGPDPNASLSRDPVSDLVGGYEVTPDGLTYTMHLRQDAMFHPPLSRPLTAADVKASWDYFTTSANNPNRAVYVPIVESFTTPDDGTAVFTLKQPYAPFLNKLANPAYLWILSQEAATGKLDPEQVVAGTGPWLLADRAPTAFTWKRNPDYFIKGLPYADAARLNVISDYSTQVPQFTAGKLDILSGFLPVDVELIAKTVPVATIHEYVQNGMSFLFFSNVQDPNSPFKDQRLRQAASLAIDRLQVIDDLYNHSGAVWQNLIPAGLGKWYLDPQSNDQGTSAKWFKHDAKMARQLIAAAGQENTVFTFLYANNAYGTIFNETADVIRRMLTDAGFNITVVTVDYLSVYINNDRGIFYKGAPQNTIVFALETPFTEPDDFLTGMLTKDGNRNHDRLDDPDLAALVRKQAIELDENKRLDMVHEIQRAHAEKMYYPPIVYTKAYVATQPWVQHFFVADDYNFGTEQYAYMSVNNR